MGTLPDLCLQMQASRFLNQIWRSAILDQALEKFIEAVSASFIVDQPAPATESQCTDDSFRYVWANSFKPAN